jgi:hypothetical protein
MGISVDVTPLIKGLGEAFSKRRERDRQICRDVLNCIRNEKSNFKRILEKKPYGPDLREPTARTQYSFEKVREAMNNMCRVRKFRAAAKMVASMCEEELSRPAEQREAGEILGLINALEARLAEYADRM